MKRCLHLVPRGGLANRLRAINSGFGFAANLGVNFSITWLARPECNCRFSDIFAPIPGVAAKSFTRVPSRILDSFYDMGLPCLFNGHIFLDNNVMSGKSGYDQLLTSIAEHDVTVRTTCDFYPDNGDFSWLRLETHLEREVARTASAFGKNTIGVHIRRGDNTRSIQYSRLEEFISLLGHEVNRDDRVQFYLATDCTQTEHDLREHFKEKLLSRKRELRRDCSQGIKDALIDMVCLSRTRKIYGSYWSSFSEVAAQIGQVPLQVVSTQVGEKP